MTKERIKEKFLELKNVNEDIENDFIMFDFLYQDLPESTYQYRMLNAIHTYEEMPNLGIEERMEYNEGEVLFLEIYGSDLFDMAEDSLTFTIDLLEKETIEEYSPYAFLGAVQAYRTIKRFNEIEERTSKTLEKKYYS